MGYYTGVGVTSAGGSNVDVFLSGIDAGGVYTLYHRTTTTTTRKSGVSLAVAQAEKGDSNMRHHIWPGGAITVACKGTKKNVSYNQINGSNLYELVIKNDQIAVKLNDGDWNV